MKVKELKRPTVTHRLGDGFVRIDAHPRPIYVKETDLSNLIQQLEDMNYLDEDHIEENEEQEFDR